MKKYFYRLLMLIFTIIVSATVVANDRSNQRIYGAGSDSCGEWLSNRKTEVNWLYEGQWILGYVSAITMIKQVSVQRTDSQAVAAWMDDYCEKHPLELLYVAVRDLILELLIIPNASTHTDQ